MYLSIFIPDFPVEAMVRSEPELRSQAVAVLEGKPPSQKIFAANALAHDIGLVEGMTKLQAEAWPGVALRCRSTLQESAAHAALLDCAQSFSPRVEDSASDTLVLDISGSDALFGPPAKLARDLAQRVSDIGMECNVAVAANPDAATLLARGYSGITIVGPGEESDRLGHLPPEVLFASHDKRSKQEAEEFLNLLERWGIRSLRSFAALPEIAVSERLGQKGAHLQKLARGTVCRTLVPVDPPLVFEEAVELEYPIVLLEPLAFLLNRMLEQICARLSARALAAQELRLKLQLEDGYQQEISDPDSDCTGEDARAHTDGRTPTDGRAPTRNANSHTSDAHANHGRAAGRLERTLSLPVPMLDSKIFLKLLQLDLKAHPPGAPITKIWLAAEPARLRPGQAGLFVPPSPEPEKLEVTMARIAGIVGEGNVGSVAILDTHRPEAFEMRHFNPHSPVITRKKKSEKAPSAQTSSNAGIAMALRMFRPPLRTTVTMHDGNPTHIVCAKRKDVAGEIVWRAGPWRSSGDWWDHEPWARDEWDIAVQSSAGLVLYHLVHDLLSGRWFVEGTYD